LSLIVGDCRQGGFVYIGSGMATFVGVPVIDFVAIEFSSGVGGFVALSG
jgi:hypothetical protein